MTVDFSDLRAAFVNCTLKPSPDVSNTAGLMHVSASIMRAQGVTVDEIRAVDHVLAPGVYADMTDPAVGSAADVDDWPALWPRIRDADVLVLGTPIWLGDKSSVCTRVIERLYAMSGELNDAGQSGFYGRVGGVVVTGNEDGVKHVAMNVLYSLQHLGYTIPPQSDTGWIGDVGPGPSYLDEGSGGPQNDFTQRNTTFMTWNLMHVAAMLKRSGGIPAWGNVRPAWDDGERFDHPNPEYR
ncbi:MAG: NAD(P)H-dependent oxidoreductase [Jiangellales bacterium]